MWAQKGDEDGPAAAPSSISHHTANGDPAARVGGAPAGAASGLPSGTINLPDHAGAVPYSISDALAPSPAGATHRAAAGGGGLLAATLGRNGNGSTTMIPQQGHTNEAGMMLLSMLTGGAAATPANPDPNLRPADAFSHAWSTPRPTLAVGATPVGAPQQQLGGATAAGSSSAAAAAASASARRVVPVAKAKAVATRTLDERFDAAQYEFFAAGAAGETLEVSTSAAIEVCASPLSRCTQHGDGVFCDHIAPETQAPSHVDSLRGRGREAPM